jgi:calpain-7
MAESSKDLERRALKLEQSISTKSKSLNALSATIASAELYMRALEIASNKDDRKRLEAKFNDLIKKADHLKSCQDLSKKRDTNVQPVSKRKLTTRENIILLEGSKLNGFIFKQWEKPPLNEEFEFQNGEQLFTDSKPLPLSQAQLDSFGGWKRPADALANIQISTDGQLLPTEPTMIPLDNVDLVQDLTSDCSVVASLCAGTSRIERGHPKVGHQGSPE